jgi:GNAT superfamily N-acetyltransferase
MSESRRAPDAGLVRKGARDQASRLGHAALRIRPTDPREGERLREIAIASKSYWGYDVDRVRQWAAMGNFSPEGLRTREVYVADVGDGQAIGWAALIPKGEACWLDDLWVEPEWIGKGIGARLFQHAAERGRQLGAARMEWEAEMHAIGFYEKMGGRYLRDSEPGVWGRVSPVMGIDLLRSSSL